MYHIKLIYPMLSKSVTKPLIASTDENTHRQAKVDIVDFKRNVTGHGHATVNEKIRLTKKIKQKDWSADPLPRGVKSTPVKSTQGYLFAISRSLKRV
jgi:hypothetical protein